MADRRTSKLQPATDPEFVEKFDVPMGDIKYVPLDQHAPFHAHGYTASGTIYLGSYTTLPQARERILEYAAALLPLIFSHPLYEDSLKSFVQKD